MISTVKEKIVQAQNSYYKLLIMLLPQNRKEELLRQIQEEYGAVKRISLSKELSNVLMNVPSKKRPFMVDKETEKLVQGHEESIIFLDNIEILFLPDLKNDPLMLFHHLSRERLITVIWPGDFENNRLTYGEPGHPEYHVYEHPEAIIADCR